MKRKFKLFLVSILVVICFLGSIQPIGINTSTALAEGIKDELKISQVYSGFKLMEKEYVEDIDSTIFNFEHEKTGARLACIKNDDERKVFGISFKTLPKDDTGVYHIIEHIFAGKADVDVGNAYTGSDFTQYYTFSNKEDEFRKYIGEYLNAVFSPDLDDGEMLFMQEGWRYEIDSPEKELNVNGIVYNEMKGRYSPTGKLCEVVDKSLVPNTIYRFDSGGNPIDIPKLTYEELLKTYNKNYIPSNSFIYLYGDMDIEKTLEFIDNGYLSKLKKVDFDNKIYREKPFDEMNVVEDYYPVPMGSGVEDGTYFSINYAFDKNTDYETNMGLNMLEMLFNSNASPFKKAISESGIGTFLGTVGDDIQQPIRGIVISNSNESKKNEVVKVVNESLNNIVKNGFDEELINSILNSYEVSIRKDNLSEERWKNYMDQARNTWLYGGNLIECFKVNSQIEKIKGKAKDGYFEKLIQKYMLNNNHSSFVVLKPKPGLEEENIKQLNDELASYKASLSKEELNALISKNSEFKKWQETSLKPKKEEPFKISLEDRNKKVEKIPINIKEINGMKVLNHPIYTNGIQYVNLYYDTTKVPQDKLMYLMLLTRIIGNVDTESYSYNQLNNAIYTYTGGVTVETIAFEDSKSKDNFYPKVLISFNTLKGKLGNAFDILDEITNKSNFDDKDNLKNLIEQIKTGIQFEIERDPFNFLSSQVSSYDFQCGKYKNLNYIPFYQFICDLDKNFDTNSDEIIKNLKEVRNTVFNKNNLIVSYTGDKADYNEFEKRFKSFADNIKANNLQIQKYEFDDSIKKEGFIIPSKVQYVAKAGNFKELGYENSGKLAVLEKVLSGYLSKEIRVKGGAYGGAAMITDSSVMFYSYRDPNLRETIEIFNGSGNYLRNFTADEDKMAKYIDRALFIVDYPSEVSYKGVKSDIMYITGKTQEDIQRYRDEILSTTVEDIRGYADMIDEILKQNNICVIGEETKIKSEKDLFQDIKNLN